MSDLVINSAPPPQVSGAVPPVGDVKRGLCNLPPFPASARKILELSASDTADLRVLEPALASDVAIAADVLRLANSPLFGFTANIHSIRHAVALLGLRRIRELIVMLSLRSYLGARDAVHRMCWEHSLATATVAERLSRLYSVRAEDSYAAGLIHDVGRLGLLKAYAKQYLPLLSSEYEDMQQSRTAERWLFQADHCQAGSWLTKAWHFPDALVHATERHHDPCQEGGEGLLHLIQVACHVATGLGFPEISSKGERDPAQVLDGLPPGVRERIAPAIGELPDQIAERIEFLA